MSTPRVVVTGVGLATPVGHTLDDVTHALQSDASGIRSMPEWATVGQLGTRVAGTIEDLELERRWDRKKTRSLGRLGLLATFASEAAVRDAGLSPELLRSERTGLAYGSTNGSSTAQEDFFRQLYNTNSLVGVGSNAYLKFMTHTCAANLALFFGIRGRVLSTCAACVSGSQAIGAGYESIRAGAADLMICGGAEEMHFLHAGVFDVLYAASTRWNDRPELTPRPFDRDRDGLVVAEGAGTIVLERLDHARARGAHIHGEIIGYGTSCDGTHVTHPAADGMASALERALRDARIDAREIDYVNAHATATTAGDVAESIATETVLGNRCPISSTKGFTGHTLGACGAIELAFCLTMMDHGFIAPNRNLTNVDPDCRDLDYVIGRPRSARLNTVMTNNFAFGGINTSIIMRRYDD